MRRFLTIALVILGIAWVFGKLRSPSDVGAKGLALLMLALGFGVGVAVTHFRYAHASVRGNREARPGLLKTRRVTFGQLVGIALVTALAVWGGLISGGDQ